MSLLEALTCRKRINGKFPEPKDFDRKFGLGCLHSSLKYGLITIGWLTTVFAVKRAFKRIPCQTLKNEKTHYSEILGIFPAFQSFLDGVTGIAHYVPYRIDLALYNYDKRRTEQFN